MLNISEFIARWRGSAPSERGQAQQFFLELCQVLGVPVPDPRPANVAKDAYFTPYGFERPVDVAGAVSKKFIDFYKESCFVIEAKQFGDERSRGATRGTERWRRLMQDAFGQGARYAQSLPGAKVPFLITCDVGHSFELWSDFTRTGSYGGYGARRTLPLEQLADEAVQAELRLIFTDPMSLDPSLRAAKVTREVAARLATLAKSLERSGHAPEDVARFLMRCLFTMFAEDVNLLGEDKPFTDALQRRWIPQPDRFPAEVVRLWVAMDRGEPFSYTRLLRFNGGLFRAPTAPKLTAEQLHELHDAAACDWSAVEPSIFGTLLERALDEVKRAELGAHFTPRAYIERLVNPTVIEPLREEWSLVQAAARLALGALGDQEPSPKAREEAARLVRDFHARLCRLRVLDPACGSGNFLYVTYDLLKRLEAEVLTELSDLSRQRELITLMPSQFLGLERNVRAREVADLVLWLGHLQWEQRAASGAPREPVLEEYRNIVARDAVLAWTREELVRDEQGRPRRVWDMHTVKPDPVTGLPVPDTDAGMLPMYRYEGVTAPDWPDADFIVGNPPFLGNKVMRHYLGDGYTEALRAAWPEVPRVADLVMYWWHRAAALTRAGKVRRFGFITTNSITQVFNRKVMEPHLNAEDAPLTLVFAVADHPWVDSGADVRIAMTVGAPAGSVQGGQRVGVVVHEAAERGDEGAAREVALQVTTAQRINADLSVGADVASATPLRANLGLCFQGMNLVGKGFRLEPDELAALGYDASQLPPVIRPYKNARDLTQGGGPRFVIDLYGLSAEEARDAYPALYQRLLLRVKPERDQNKRDSRRKNWWIFGEPVGRLRRAWAGLERYIITPITAKHRFFVMHTADLIPDCQLMVVATDSAWIQGVLSARPHTVWSLAAGSTLEDRPRWRNGTCFDPYPFPDPSPQQRDRIGALAERLDAHRTAAAARDPKVHLTAQYNALTRYREVKQGGAPLSPAERAFQDAALTALLAELHDALDLAVAEAYGWPAELSDPELLARLVALNATRAAEEAAGKVRYLRPDLQASDAEQLELATETAATAEEDETAIANPWPKDTLAQLQALRDAIRPRAEPWRFDEITRAFRGAKRDALRNQLDALTALGVLVATGEPPTGWTRA